jgi:ubiquitin-conjugating enzyme E2 J1
MREAAEMASATADYFATPLEDNLFEWHFTVRGPESTDFEVREGILKNFKFA